MKRISRWQSGKSLKFHAFLFVWVLVSGSAPGGGMLLPAAGLAAEAPGPVIIVIDPGHGGHDPGAKGREGSLEKDAALLFARTLSTVLAPEFTVVLTRTGDYQMDAVKRASAGNYHRARLFITIHAGGGFLREMNHWSVLYYKKDEMKKHPDFPGPAQSDNHEGQAGIPWEQVQQAHSKESRDLAECVRSQLAVHPAISEVHVAGAALRVLQGLDRPAIAIETGYLTNPGMENRLKNLAFLTEAARCIKKGIDVYLSR